MIDALDIAQSVMYAKQRDFEFWDKAGKQFSRVLSEHPERRKEVLMKLDSGELTTKAEEKLNIFVRFYSELYKSGSSGCTRLASFLENIELKELTSDHIRVLEASIGLNEINKAIVALRCNSSPGLDGLTPEVYKCFSHVLARHLQELFNHCLMDGKILPSWRRAKIILLPKQGKDLHLPES